MIYLVESRALAALEILVHAPREVLPLEWRILEVEVPDRAIRHVAEHELPQHWRLQPASAAAQRFGGEWLRKREELALCLPSVIIPEEHGLLMNPAHPDAARLVVSEPAEFRFDARFGIQAAS